MRVGLVVEGNATSSPVLRLSSLRDELGPIKAGGLQVARRVSNSMGAGYAVAEYQELDCAQLILLRLPDSQTARVVREICETDLPFSDICFVLCESWLNHDVLIPLRRLGAHAASLLSIGPVSHAFFVVEGDSAAVRRMKRLVADAHARAIELRPGAKSLFFAADLLSTAIPIPVLQLAQQALRESGVSGHDLAFLTAEWAEECQGRIRKGGRTIWGGPLTECSEEIATEHFRQLAILNPRLAANLQDWLSLSRRHMSMRAKGHSV